MSRQVRIADDGYRQLAEVLTEFARTMVTDFPIQGILDRLVTRIVDILPVAAAGVTLISPGADPRFVAASDDDALQFERLQTELGEGPCVRAYHTGDAVAIADLRQDLRFPSFAPRAVDAGLRAVFAFPLRHDGQPVGALDLYRKAPGGLTDEAMETAQTLADVATAYLLNAEARADLEDSSRRSREAALHDGLTGLANRVLLLERLEHAFLRGRRSGKRPVVFFVDLDRFKAVNDTYGHRVGDELLVAVAQRMTRVVRPGDTLARLAGDEFVILCEDVDTPADASAIAVRLESALARPFVLADHELSMTASIGLATVANGDDSPERLLHHADTAMYQAKRQGGARHQIFDLSQPDLDGRRGSLAEDLHTALAQQQLHLAYQPIVTTADGRITGVEALLRWTHPTRRTVSPTVLIPLAEQYGLITEIGIWVLQQAWADRLRWQSQRLGDDLVMYVNVSAHQLIAPGFARAVADVLEMADSDPGLLTLELTESVFVSESDRALVVLNDLKDLGVKLALDDFGTGYSSLSYLRRFPVDILKIDRVFVSDLGRDSVSHKIVAAVVELAHNLGMTVIAEGVETAQQHLEVARLKCDSCQGYYFARPMTAGDLDSLIHAGPDGRDPRLPRATVAAES